MPDLDTASDEELIATFKDVTATEVLHQDRKKPEWWPGLWYNRHLALLLEDVVMNEDRTVINGCVVNGAWEYRYRDGQWLDVRGRTLERKMHVTKEQATDWHQVPDVVLKSVEWDYGRYHEIMASMDARLTTQAG
jgi:hypothetical protein